ncbi:MAG: ABC transporter permease subunit, partial [Anaerolineaceae bacterium]
MDMFSKRTINGKKPVNSSAKVVDAVVSPLIKACGYSAIIFVIMIFYFLWSEGVTAIREVPFSDLFSTRWYPIEGYYGILPLIGGSLVVTLGATIFAVPIGLSIAIYLSEIAPRWLREILKPIIEILGGLPSVVLGFLGILILSPFLRNTLDLPTGLTALAGSILLGAIAIPTIVSIAEDALDAVPRSYRDAALALGATRWQT